MPNEEKNGNSVFFLQHARISVQKVDKQGKYNLHSLQCEPERIFYFLFFSSNEGKKRACRPNNILSVALYITGPLQTGLDRLMGNGD